MDVKSLISYNSPALVKTFKEPSYSFVKGLLNHKNGSHVNTKQDALEAVKLDPAVLEAQVTVHAKDKTSNVLSNASNLNSTQNVFIEKKKEKDPAPSSSTSSQGSKSFEDMVMQHEAALLSLTPTQLELLMKYADILRRQRMITQRYLECAFCKNNGKPSFWYTSHALKDGRGRVRCPILRGFCCPRCGATGDKAHTIKYCPDNSLLVAVRESHCTDDAIERDVMKWFQHAATRPKRRN